MEKGTPALAILASLVTAHSAIAQEEKPQKLFAVVEVGMAEHAIDASGGYEDEKGDSFSPSLALGYMYDSNISIIAQYTQYGEADLFSSELNFEGVILDTTFSSETTGVSLVGQYMTDLSSSGWSFGAKLGLIRWDTDLNFTATSGGASASDTLGDDSGVSIYGGVVVSYALSQRMAVTLNADWFVNDLDVELIEGSQVDMQNSRYSMGLRYSF